MWPVSFLRAAVCEWDNAHTSDQVMRKKKNSIEGRLHLQIHSRSAGVEILWAIRNSKIQF